jgi:hypothetical protein
MQAAPRARRPELALTRIRRFGQRAIELLGSTSGRARFLRQDARGDARDPGPGQRVKLDKRGQMFVVDELEHRCPRWNTRPPTSRPPPLPGALTDTFKLHSRPSAKRTVYLDFNGAVLQNTVWNEGGPATINAKAFDSTAIPTPSPTRSCSASSTSGSASRKTIRRSTSTSPPSSRPPIA